MTPGQANRRGAVSVVVVIVLVVLTLAAIGATGAAAVDSDLVARRAESMAAFYAAEAGMNMAIRELMLQTDHDGDGHIGSISFDGNAANDPALGDARVSVALADDSGQTVLTATGRRGQARRSISLTLE